MARTVRDVAMMLGVIAGHDARDATSSRRRVGDYVAALDTTLPSLRVGIPENYYSEGLGTDVRDAVNAAVRTLETLGAKVETLRVPDPEVIAGVSNVLARCESAATHVRLMRERPHEVQPTVLLRLEAGLHISAYDYLQAARLRARLTREFVAEVFDAVDVLVVPTIPEPAPSYELVKSGSPEERVRRMGRFSRLTRPFNGLGLPSLAIPCGRSMDGRPLGLQIVGRPFAEATILHLGHAYERATSWTALTSPVG